MSSALADVLAPSSRPKATSSGDTAMNTAHGAAGLEQTSASTRRVSDLFRRYWGAFQERRKRLRLQVTLCDLNDRELQDIGIARGEIDYVASNRSIDPRGIRSIPPMNV
jgi:uncharacterized protein YjiS (DUF1127 family)